MKLVIVEDEEALLGVLSEKMRKAGFEVLVARDGEEGMRVIEKSNPDLVLLDLILPKKDGFEVLLELKARQDLKMIPVIVLSNLDEDENLKKALRMGAEDYIVKTQHTVNEVVEKVADRLMQKGK
jgi:DNA-binding response OmpR family regulator